MFLLGARGSLKILQVRETGGDVLSCVVLAEIVLGAGEVPVWLREGATADEHEEGTRSCPGEQNDSDPLVLAAAAAGCRVQGLAALGLRGTAALAVSTESLYALLGHQHRAERVCGVPALGAAAACVDAQGGLLAVCAFAFESGGEVLRLNWSEELRLRPEDQELAGMGETLSAMLQEPAEQDAAFADPPMCSVVPLGPIPPDSVLGRALSQGGSTRRAGSMPQRTRSNRSVNAMNQPVTFHKKVKSAGYGPPTEPPRVLGKPRLNTRPLPSKPDFGPPKPGQRPSRPRSSSGQGPGPSGIRALAPGGPPLEHCPDMAISACEGYAVTDISFSPQASHLMVVGSDRTVSAYKLPLARGRPPGSSHGSRPLGLAGHQGDIVSLCPSYTESHSTGGGGGPLLLTCGDDRTARLWALAGPHAGAELIRFDRLRGNGGSCSRSQASWGSEDNPLLDQVQDSHFLCLDGAIALATGARLAVYRFQLHVQDISDDIKRLQRLGSYRCCGLLTLPREPSAGQGIVALAANNAVLSGTVLVASSSKRVYVWDVAAEKVLATVPDPIHAKAVTCLRMAQPYAGQSASSMDMFYTAGMDGCIKLWDLRTMQECRCFRSGHVHSAQRLRCRLSPCLRYMATPSEEGSVCVYDVRTGNVLGSKHCHKDAAVAVDLHPRTGAMASGGFDGQVQFFRSPQGSGRPPGGGGGLRSDRLREAPAGLREVEMELPI